MGEVDHVDGRQARPYALKAGEGWTYNYGIDFTVKAGELGLGRRLAFVEYTTRAGEEPPDHTHATEDEIFYVLAGELAFRCGDDTFELSDGGFVFLPRGIEHGYRIISESDVRLLAVTAPAQDDAQGGWGGFVADFEAQGEPRGGPPGFA
jgi:quercetin dioxygenase-like cupin family protein